MYVFFSHYVEPFHTFDFVNDLRDFPSAQQHYWHELPVSWTRTILQDTGRCPFRVIDAAEP